MKVLFRIIGIAVFLFSVNQLSAQCGAQMVVPSPQATGVCEGMTDTVTFAPTGNCPGSYEYQIESSNNVVIQPWTASNQYIFTPDSTDTYNVLARCSTCPSTVVTDTFLVEVVQEPSILADTITCYGTPLTMNGIGDTSVTLSWWDTPDNNGNQLATTSSYTTPPLTANDTFYLHANGTVAGGTTGSILITEAGTGGFPGASSADYLEIANLYGTAINTTGWVAAINGTSYTNINTVNPVIWNLPSNFAPCSMVSRTDVQGNNYWGSNMFWNPGNNGWAIIIDDQGNVVDFIGWGWSNAQLASFNVNINGFNITLGPSDWIGNSCPPACGANGAGNPFSFSRVGNTDNNNAADFVCQATSLNQVNPSLNCGWVSSNITCPVMTTVVVDMPPTGTAPDTTFVECYANIPAPDSLIIDDEADDNGIPTVQYMGETSNGMMCPEILTRTYRVQDSCSNFIDLEHIIIINDTIAPVMDPAPQDLAVACYSDIPPIDTLNWTDNCLGSGTVVANEVSSGTTCPEVFTRTWTVTDTCGNVATQTQIITVHDTIAPVIDAAPADLTLQCYDDIPPMVSLNWTDNCDGSGVLNGSEVSDGQTCPETFTRTWSYIDGCGNAATQTQVIIVNDNTPPTADPLPSLQLTELPPADTNIIQNVYDNCGTPVLAWVGDNSNGGFCPEYVTRTYSLTDGCGNITFLTQEFTIGDNPPNVSFTADPTLLDNLSDGIVNFTNNTTGAESYTWDFGDFSDISNATSPSHEYDITQTTTYDVWLVAASPFDCLDSATLSIDVFQELIYFVPNAFTPDGDQFNQTFNPVFAAGFDPLDYNFIVMNRWGEILFESNDDTQGWDGTYGGKIVEEGTYLYKIEFGLENNDARKIVTGHVSLIK